jgi:predicted PurR-regulated permease PerM
MQQKNQLLSQAFQVCAIVLAVSTFALLVYTGRFGLMMGLIGIGLATLVSPMLRFLHEKFKIPRVLSVVTFLIVVALVLALGFWGIGNVVIDQLEDLTLKAPELMNKLEERWSALYERYPIIQDQISTLNISATLKAGGSQIVKGAQSGATLVSGLAFAFVIAMYASISAQSYLKRFVGLFPASKRERVTSIMGRLALTLRKWFRAQLTDMAIIGGLTMFGLWLVGAKYWAVFGLLTAILGLIPYLGILIMVVVAGLVTFASDPLMVPWVLGVFVITQQIEGNIVLPLVMKDQIDIPEMPLLIFMLLMATWFGLIGVFLSTPVFALFKVLHAELIRPKLESS